MTRNKSKNNKLLSYNNKDRTNKNFKYKNFEQSDSYNTQFTRSNFSYVNFSKSKMKYCGFNGAIFEETEFKNSNFRGSRFKGAKFKNALFYHTNLSKTNFEDVEFENTVFIGTSLKQPRGISKNTLGIIYYSNLPNVSLSQKVERAIKNSLDNSYILKSEVIRFKKKKKLNTINIIKLLNNFTEKELIYGLKKAKDDINNDFYTLSYLINFISKNKGKI